MRLKNLSPLADIRALSGLGDLNVLDIQYCKKTAIIETINDLAKLRELKIVGCGKLGLEQMEAKINSLQKKMVGATI
ncbi:hypothetical protein [uncultured Stenotrophomonas sp.]|uniref:hypothetical protein n=1 Tax=uncultured Stenotrophomonas sp. TaxID=165438 RepID=UPI0025DC5249|nr:hypothetical protein [uncultured Stenotrophomonas sp.]